MGRRRFEFVDGKSDKFWEIEQDGSTVNVNYGRNGTSGQASTKTYDTDAKAKADFDKQIAGKVKKGYVEVTAGSATMAQATPKPAAPPKTEAAPAAQSVAAAPAAKVVEAVSPAPSALTPEAPAAPAAAPIDYSGDERVELSEEDYAWVPWRKIPRKVRPPAVPFDLANAIKLLREAHDTESSRNRWISSTRSTVNMTPAEAWFWIRLNTLTAEFYNKPRRFSLQQLYNELATFAEPPPDTDEDWIEGCHRLTIGRTVTCDDYPIAPRRLVALACMVSAEKLATMMVGDTVTFEDGTMPYFKSHVVAYLSDEDLAVWQRVVRTAIQSLQAGVEDMYRMRLLAMAGLLGMSDIVDLRDESHQFYHYAEMLNIAIITSGSPEVCRSAADQLKFTARNDGEAYGLIAQLGVDALDIFANYPEYRKSTYGPFEPTVNGLCRIISPRTAPLLWQATADKAVAATALKWLMDHPVETVIGLTPLMEGRSEKAKSVVRFLKRLLRGGADAAFDAALTKLPAEQVNLLQEKVIGPVRSLGPELTDANTPDWLCEALATAKPVKKLPDFLEPAALPPIPVGEGRMSAAQTASLLGALKDSTAEAAHPAVVAVKAHTDATVLDDFAWALFECWGLGGYDNKQKWLFESIGHIGSDASVDRLTPMIKQWPFESQYKRSCNGLDIFQMIGSDRALMQITSIAQKAKSKGLQTHANKVVEAIAASRGMTRQELADRCVPDLGFDERGKLIYDFGPRSFEVLLDANLKPAVRDSAGKIKPSLPKPNQSDDAEKAAAAIEDWKTLKKQLSDLLKLQVLRLEQAMVVGRSWSVEEFTSFFAGHPVMTLIARRVLWTVVDAAGKPEQLFRLTDEQDFATVDDDPFELPSDRRVGIVHPLYLSQKQRNAWSEVFADYGIIAPFPQLDRPSFTLADVDPTSNKLFRGEANALTSVFTIMGVLEKSDWERGAPEDGGQVMEYYKSFPTANQHATLVMDPGYCIGYPSDSKEQKLPEVHFFTSKTGNVTWNWGKREFKVLTLAELDPIVLSEMILDLENIAAKSGEPT